MKNSILLKRNLKVLVQNGDSQLPAVYLATALKNIESLGFTFSDTLIEKVKTLSPDAFVAFYQETVATLKEMVGAHVTFAPMYPNFPSQVMEMSDAEIYINAIIHYVTLLLPQTEAKERFPLLDRVDLKTIDLGSEEEFIQLISHLIGANTSISATDKEDIKWAIEHIDNPSNFLPEAIPHKENLSFTMAVLLNEGKVSAQEASSYFKTATDVLRLAVALSDGDVSLAVPTRFRKFKRAERRFLLGLLEACSNVTEDMLRYKRRWIRLGEILHPGEYRTKFPKTNRAFDVLRNDLAFETFNGKVEKALEQKDVLTAIDLLKSRPGEFARRLDHLLRLANDGSNKAFLVLAAFSDVAEKIATPVLLQLSTHFTHRNDENELRTFFPKGNVAKIVGIDNNLPSLDANVCAMIVKTCEEALKVRFGALPSLGKVYLDERLKDYVIPFSQRSASKALRTLVRGSKVDLPEGDFLRFFLYWKEGKVGDKETGCVDIDLSSVLYGEEWDYKEHVSFTNIHSSQYHAVHSGDITSAPFGASEFIDINIPKALELGVRYVVTSIHSFTVQPFKDLPECFAGWMVRQEPNTGAIFEPKTVQDKIDISADSTIAIPAIIDLKERKVIWCDLSLSRHLAYHNTVEANQASMVLLGKSMLSMVKPNLYDLFRLHLASRGEQVEDVAEAETVYSLDEGVTPFDIETIMSDYIA